MGRARGRAGSRGSGEPARGRGAPLQIEDTLALAQQTIGSLGNALQNPDFLFLGERLLHLRTDTPSSEIETEFILTEHAELFLDLQNGSYEAGVRATNQPDEWKESKIAAFRDFWETNRSAINRFLAPYEELIERERSKLDEFETEMLDRLNPSAQLRAAAALQALRSLGDDPRSKPIGRLLRRQFGDPENWKSNIIADGTKAVWFTRLIQGSRAVATDPAMSEVADRALALAPDIQEELHAPPTTVVVLPHSGWLDHTGPFRGRMTLEKKEGGAGVTINSPGSDPIIIIFAGEKVDTSDPLRSTERTLYHEFVHTTQHIEWSTEAGSGDLEEIKEGITELLVNEKYEELPDVISYEENQIILREALESAGVENRGEFLRELNKLSPSETIRVLDDITGKDFISFWRSRMNELLPPLEG